MKKILVVFSALTLSLGVMAQEGKTGKMEKKQDCVMMKDGKVVEMKDGKTMPVTSDKTMKNGTVVMTDGTMKMKDGTTMKMKEGECMTMDGKMEKKKNMNKDTKMKSGY